MVVSSDTYTGQLPVGAFDFNLWSDWFWSRGWPWGLGEGAVWGEKVKV